MVRKVSWSILSTIFILPILSFFYLSVVKSWIFPSIFNVSITLENWINIIDDDTSLLYSLFLSLVISLFVAFLSTFFAFIISKKLILDYNIKGWLKWIFFPYIIAPVIFGSMLQYYFIRLNLIGTSFGVILSQFFFILPYSIVFFSVFWTLRIRNLTHCAYLLGSTKRQVYKTILIPIAKPFILLCFLQCFLFSWFEYGITQVIGIGKVKTMTIQTMKYMDNSDISMSSISSFIMVFSVWMLILLLFFAYKLKWTKYLSKSIQ